MRPHFEKSFEELEKDHEVAWQRFTKNYERATSPERTKIQARTGEEEELESSARGNAGALADYQRQLLLLEQQNNQRLREASASQSGLSKCPFIEEERQLSSRDRHVAVPALLHPSSNDDDMLAFPIASAFDRFPSPFSPYRYLAWEPDFTSGTHRPTAHFFAFNPYSPHHLEHDNLMQQEGARWRFAFEDLLVAQEGAKEFKQQDAPTAWKPITTWIEELQNRGLASRSISPRDVLEDEYSVEEAFNSSRRESRAEVDSHRLQGVQQESSITELDLYEQFLGGKRITDRRQDKVEMIKPTVTSTLTTTERRRLPDGTVTTKSVLKKRFADGSEESEEKTDTTHVPSTQQRSQRSEPVCRQVEQAAAEHKGKDKSGWFWSS